MSGGFSLADYGLSVAELQAELESLRSWRRGRAFARAAVQQQRDEDDWRKRRRPGGGGDGGSEPPVAARPVASQAPPRAPVTVKSSLAGGLSLAD